MRMVPYRRSAPPPKVRVLHIEDSPAVVDIFRDWYPREGFRAEFASTGREGLQKLRDEGPFDVVVCDLDMPGLSGIDVLREVRKINPKQPFVFLAGYAKEAEEAAGKDPTLPKATAYLPKPCAPEELITALRKAAGLKDSL